MSDANTEEPLTPDEALAAVAYLEAAQRGDDDARRALARRDETERPMPTLLAVFGQQVISSMTTGSHGLDETTVRVSSVLAATLAAWAAHTDDVASDAMAHSIIAFIQAVSRAADEDVLPLLARLRAAALRVSGES
ncbi:hypothetical protein [Streptomyces sp. JJ38]|uniref:hypothetical protein n=1 Tax=Streptomyces sp. JJ38 TaxID=2738128 RepID=UPI001C5598CF|nr:hypothetical protein [Streptomyces sp. JJ38]MBW1599894.1 hypothetical protein [Streptomyces sp. JJ38]